MSILVARAGSADRYVGVAAEAAQDLVARLSGATVSSAQATQAVRTALRNG